LPPYSQPNSDIVDSGITELKTEHDQNDQTMKYEFLFAVVVPYYFAQGNVSLSGNALTDPGLIDIATLVEQTKKYASKFMIDPTRNMLDDRVFIFHGLNDTLVLPGHSLYLTSDRLLSIP